MFLSLRCPVSSVVVYAGSVSDGHWGWNPKETHQYGLCIRLYSTNQNGGVCVCVWECTEGWDVHGHNRNDDGLTDLLAAFLSSVVHDDWWVDERAGGGHILSQQAFHFVRTQTDGQIEELHWPSLDITGKDMSKCVLTAHFTPKLIISPSCQEKNWWRFIVSFVLWVSWCIFRVTTA